MNEILAAYHRHQVPAEKAMDLFVGHAPRSKRVPGMDTVIRLAWRIENGRTIEESAAKEYLYRWHLALDGILNRSIWAADEFAPHALGL